MIRRSTLDHPSTSATSGKPRRNNRLQPVGRCVAALATIGAVSLIATQISNPVSAQSTPSWESHRSEFVRQQIVADTYQRQLIENEYRKAAADRAQQHYRRPVYQTPAPSSSAPNTFSPPVHITPPARSASNRSNSDHVYLQDRIARSIKRHLGKPKARSEEQNRKQSEKIQSSIEIAQAKANASEPQSVLFSDVDSMAPPAPVEPTAQESFQDIPVRRVVHRSKRKRRPTSVDVNHESLDFQISLGDDDGPLNQPHERVHVATRADGLTEPSSRHGGWQDDAPTGATLETPVVRSSWEEKKPRDAKTSRTEPRFAEVVRDTKSTPRQLNAPRPVAYRAAGTRLRADEVSVLIGDTVESTADTVRNLNTPSGEVLSLDREDASPMLTLRQDSASDRIRSRLDDFDFSDSDSDSEMEEDLSSDSASDLQAELDREIEAELDEELNDSDDEDDDNVRPRQRPCRDFRDELLAGSIRDISLDISPPAFSSDVRFGGPGRSWTDRDGVVLATGTMIDLRRGYVILEGGQKIPYARLSETDLAIVSEFWRLPSVCLLGNIGASPYRCWTPQVVTWKASSLCHKPLYFENVQLERYGHSRGPFAQPVHSTWHFFRSLVTVPYQTAIWPATECQYALGYFRPGDCAPWLKDAIPFSLAGVQRQATFVTGAAFTP